MALTLARLVNLLYYVIVRNLDTEKRYEFDRLLLPPAALEVQLPSGTRRRAPSWWKGDRRAASSSLEAAKQLGFGVGNVDLARTG